MEAFNQDGKTWNTIISGLSGAHLLQTWEWGELKQTGGWRMLPYLWRDSAGNPIAAAMILERTIRFGGFSMPFRVLYIPRGPVMDWADSTLREQVLMDLQKYARDKRAIFLKMDPEVLVGRGIPESSESVEEKVGIELQESLKNRGWVFSTDQIQFRNTVWLNVQGTEDDWLARMKQKTRYNLRLSERKGVTVRRGSVEDFPLLFRMYAETSVRDGFVIRPETYYTAVWKKYTELDMAVPLIAEADGEAIAAIFVFWFAGKAWYIYGMSREAQREKMPNYLLQWRAMQLAKEHGCQTYDLWGAPDVFDESDRMWGVFRFKEGLGGEVIRTLGAWDYISQPLVYALYTRILPQILEKMRRTGKEKTRQEVNE